MLKELPKVGDKVRIINCEECPEAKGKVGTITQFFDGDFDVDVPSIAYGDTTYIDTFSDSYEVADDEPQTDAVNHPQHYTKGNVEVIDYIDQVADGYPGKQAVYAGNIIKYVSRAPYKNGVEDAKKAAWYLSRLVDAMEAEASE